MLFAEKIINWFSENRRDLPWRNTQDPYRIWISEIILQQTRVVQGYDYYLRFLERFPNVETLARASEEEVLKLWQGLGYYSRARNLHTAAKEIMQNHNGCFPQHYQEILSLKGIGKYTAAAVSSFAFHEVQPVVDGNVYRFIARLFGIYTPINSSKAYNEFETLLFKLIDPKQPDTFNQAIMEFGALLCKPRNPLCQECVFAQECVAFRENKQDILPIKENKTVVKSRYFYYLAFEIETKEGNYTFLQKRTQNDIWKNLYQFPLLENSEKLETGNLKESLANYLAAEGYKEKDYQLKPEITEYKHQLSHQTLYAHFVTIQTTKVLKVRPESWLYIPKNEICNYAVPRLMDLFLTEKRNFV